MKKRTVALMLCAMMAFGAAGCGSDQDGSAGGTELVESTEAAGADNTADTNVISASGAFDLKGSDYVKLCDYNAISVTITGDYDVDDAAVQEYFKSMFESYGPFYTEDTEKKVIEEGDIVNVDVSTIFHGYYSDASRMFMIGEVSEEARNLVEVTKECLNIGMDAVKPWGHVGDIGAAIHKYATSRGYSVVVDFAGHGVGKEFHEDPVIGHVGRAGSGMVLAPGMVFTIEPMINVGDYHLYIDEDNGWTSYTEDGSLSAQWEHTLLVTEHGIEILTY
mgnify:CR=1 FL=1